MIEVECEQGTPEWDRERIGNPGASCFHKIITTKGARSASRQAYLNELFDEIILNRKLDKYSSSRMKDGLANETLSRKHYEYVNDVIVRQTGLVYKDAQKKYHVSPDGLIDPEGWFETKDALPHIQKERLQKGTLPTEHFIQCQGYLLMGRKWCDFQSYCEGMEALTIRVFPDHQFLKRLEEELDLFVTELHMMVKKIKEIS